MNQIAIVTHGLGSGGVEKVLVEMLKVLDYTKCSIDLYLFKNSDESSVYRNKIPKEVSVYTLEPLTKDDITKYPIRCLKKFYAVKFDNNEDYNHSSLIQSKMVKPISKKYDIAISYHSVNGMSVPFVAESIKAKRKILWLHGGLREGNVLFTKFEKLYGYYDVVVGVSQDICREYRLNFASRYKQKVFEIRNIIPVEEIKQLAESGESYNDNYTGRRIITVGRLVKEKNPMLALEIAQRLKRAGVNFKWHFFGDGYLHDELAKKIQELGLEGFVILNGFVENVYPYMKQSNVCVHLGENEGYCTVTNEAKVLNVPVVAISSTGMKEQLDSYAYGRVVIKSAPILTGSILEAFNMRINPNYKASFENDLDLMEPLLYK